MIDLAQAEFGIRQLHARYGDAVWRKDIAAFGSCFTEDCEWRISGRALKGRREIVDFMAYVFPLFRRILLTMRTPMVHQENGYVGARTYFTEQSVKASGEPLFAIGTYFDRCVQIKDRWLFNWRLFQSEYAGPPDMSGPLYENPEWGPPPAMPPRDATAVDHSGVI